jgi:hypothetical protein
VAPNDQASRVSAARAMAIDGERIVWRAGRDLYIDGSTPPDRARSPHPFDTHEVALGDDRGERDKQSVVQSWNPGRSPLDVTPRFRLGFQTQRACSSTAERRRYATEAGGSIPTRAHHSPLGWISSRGAAYRLV